MALAAPGAESTNSARLAPLERASIPTAPVPAKRSRTSASITRSPRLEKRPSRTRSPIGRVPAGTGASRTPFADPAITRIAFGDSAVEQPFDGLAREGPTKERQQIRLCVQLRISGDQIEGATPGPLHQLNVLGQPGQLQVGQSRLLDVEQGALAPQLEVLIRQLEPVSRALHGRQARLGLLVVRRALVEQDAHRRVCSAPDPPPQLVEL